MRKVKAGEPWRSRDRRDVTYRAPELGPRALNRPLLDRQLLTDRSGLSAVDAVAHLLGLQVQPVRCRSRRGLPGHRLPGR